MLWGVMCALLLLWASTTKLAAEQGLNGGEVSSGSALDVGDSISENERSSAKKTAIPATEKKENSPGQKKSRKHGATSRERSDSETLILKNGDLLHGRNSGLVDGSLQWKTPGGELLRVPLPAIDRIEYPLKGRNGELPLPFDDDAIRSVLGPEHNPRIFPDDPDDGFFEPLWDSVEDSLDETRVYFKRWTQRFELGARFLDGNSNDDFLNTTAKFDRETKLWHGQLEFNGQYGQSNGRPTSNRWIGNATYDQTARDQWIYFATAKNEHDQFEKLDYRGVYSTGLGYRFLQRPDNKLVLRVGPAATYERFHNPAVERTTPDLFGEIQANLTVFPGTQFETTTTIHQSVVDTDLLRLVSNSGLLFRLDEHGLWKLKLGFRLEYNEKPAVTRKPGDYTTTLQLVYTRK